MSERRGYQRIEYLLGADPGASHLAPDLQLPVWQLMTDKEVMVECTAALIEIFTPLLAVIAGESLETRGQYRPTVPVRDLK